MNKIKALVESKIMPEESHWSSSGNVHQLSDDIFSWTDYNFLPSKERPLDGHYTFFLNYKTFDWRLYKSSDYGGLCYMTPVEYTGLLTKKDFTKTQVKHLEHFMACKISEAYFYDSAHINHKGKRLIEPDEIGGYGSLICDNRGYMWVDHPEKYEVAELQALKEMIGFEPKLPEIKMKFSERSGANASRVVSKTLTLIDRTNFIPVEINGVKATLVHEILFSKQTHTGLLYEGKLYCMKSFSNGFADYMRQLPDALANYADSPFNKAMKNEEARA